MTEGIEILRTYVPVTSRLHRIRIAYTFNTFMCAELKLDNGPFGAVKNIIIPEIPAIVKMTGCDPDILKNSGITFFYFCCMYSYSVNKIANLEGLAYIVLAYLYVDMALDNGKGEKMLGEIEDAVINGNVNQPNSRIVTFYNKLLAINPDVQGIAAELFIAQVQSTKIQTTPNLPLQSYIDICRRKGALTFKLINAIVGFKMNEEEINNIGETAQMVDDLYDVLVDINDGVSTQVTVYYQKHGHIDEILTKLLKRIHRLDNCYMCIKLSWIFAALHTCAKYDLLSKHYRRKIEPYILFDPRYGINFDVLF